MPKSRVKLKQYSVRVNGVLLRKSFASATEARKWQADQKRLQDQIRSGTKRYLEPTFLAAHAGEWLGGRREMESFRHQETWMGKYVLARPRFQDKMLHELTIQDWKEIFGKNGELVREHKLGPRTHNRVRSMVHKMYEDARREFVPPRALDNPIHDIKPLPEPKNPLQILGSKEAIRSYIEQAYQLKAYPAYGIYTAIKLNTGLRQQNMIPLRWKDWAGDGAVLRIREKYIRNTHRGFRPGNKSGEEERKVGVNATLREALQHWRSVTAYPDDEDFIVCDQKDGSHYSSKQIWIANRQTLAAAGMEYMSEHKLRHSYATHYLAAGGSIHDLKLNLFHSSVTTTEIYSHALESELARRAEAFQTEPIPFPKPIKKDTQ